MSDINKYFQDYKSKDDNYNFDSVSGFLAKNSVKGKRTQKRSKASKVFHVISLNKAKMASLCVFGFLLFLGNYPVSKLKTVGYIYSFTVSQENLKEMNDNIQKLEWLDKSSLTMNEIDSGGKKFYQFKVLLNSPSDSLVLVKKTQIQNLAKNLDVSVTPISSSVKIPAYTAALSSVFNYDFVPKVINMDEFEDNISQQMKDAGVDNGEVFVKTDYKGNDYYVIDVPEKIKIKVDSLKRLVMKINIPTEDIETEIPNSITFYQPENPKAISDNYGNYRTISKRQGNYPPRQANFNWNNNIPELNNFDGIVIIEMPDKSIKIDKKNNSIEIKEKGKVYLMKPGEILISPEPPEISEPPEIPEIPDIPEIPEIPDDED